MGTILPSSKNPKLNTIRDTRAEVTPTQFYVKLPKQVFQKQVTHLTASTQTIYLWKRKGCKSDAKYYRPITLDTSISKIIEGILHHKLQKMTNACR